jgi:NAD(P)-dependent dehydrogenase (short-subunit alcohol dehydrogenase family)
MVTASPNGLVVAITGTGSGIGNALARCFRADGATVSGCDLAARLDAAEAVCNSAVRCDVTDMAQVEEWIDGVISRFGRVDVLVANAGIARSGTVEEGDLDEIARILRVNFFGVLHADRAVLAPMRRQGKGRIVNLASRNAEFCPPGSLAYTASKAAVIALTRTLAHELADVDILVNNLLPGITRTAMNPGDGRDPELCYSTARMMATLATGGPSGQTFTDDESYAIYSGFADDSKPPLRPFR